MKINKLTIIFPVFNEVNSIEKVLSEWILILKKYKGLNYELLICEDGSKDGTSELLRKIKNKYKLSLNQAKIRRGYGGAVINGIESAKHDYILCVDSDGQCDPSDFSKFFTRINNTVLIGNRIRRSDELPRLLFSRLFYLFFKLLFPCRISDPSAPYVLFDRKTIIPRIKYLRFLQEGFWWGFVATCVKFDIPIKEIPINHRNRFDGKTQVYKPSKILGIALRNCWGLFKLKFK